MLIITGLSKTYGSGVRTIAALQEPDEGTIVLDGLDVLAEPHELRRRLGYLPQDFGVYPGISALLLLDHIAVLKGINYPEPDHRRRADGGARPRRLENVYFSVLSSLPQREERIAC